MARAKNGPYGPIVGKLGNTVNYIRLGQPVMRMLGNKTTKPSTVKQLAARARFAVVTKFIKPINLFTNVGFKMKAKQTIGKTAQNMAVSVNLNLAVQGEYPDYKMDYSKAVISEGELFLPENIAVELTGNHLKYTWDIDVNWRWAAKRDQVMMLAFFPDTNRANSILSGARRSAGEDTLELAIPRDVKPWQIKDTCIETYIAFISDDREGISDSLYMGRIEL